MFVLDSVAVADTFPTDGQQGGAQIVAQNGSNGGYAAVTGADVYVQLAYQAAPGASLEWTPPVHVAPGNLILAAGTRGIRFRNYVAGQVATVSAGLSEPLEPALQLSSAGVATPATTNMVTGIVTGAGAIAAGTGFTVNRTGVGVYVIAFTASQFAATPVCLVNAIDATLTLPTPITRSQNGFTVDMRTAGNAPVDNAFNFSAFAIQ